MNDHANDQLMLVTSRLREPAAPDSLRAAVMARIARDADLPRTVPQPREQPRWLLALAGLAVVICATAYGLIDAESLPDVTSPRIGSSLALIPTGGPIALVIGIGLLIYMAGLVAPLRNGRRR